MHNKNITSNSTKCETANKVALHYPKDHGILANEENKVFLSTVVHNIKNPFGALLGYSELMIEDYSDLNDAERVLYMEEIKKTADFTYKYMDRFFEWMYYKTGKIEYKHEVIEVRKVITSAVKKVLNKTDHNFEIIFEMEDDLAAYADFRTVKKLFYYIIENAVEYSKPNGKINIKAIIDYDFVKIEIIDNGIGIDANKLNQLFDITKISPNNENGTGLGLILSEQLIQLNNGSINIKSNNNCGTKVTVKLPSKHQIN